MKMRKARYTSKLLIQRTSKMTRKVASPIAMGPNTGNLDIQATSRLRVPKSGPNTKIHGQMDVQNRILKSSPESSNHPRNHPIIPGIIQSSPESSNHPRNHPIIPGIIQSSQDRPRLLKFKESHKSRNSLKERAVGKFKERHNIEVMVLRNGELAALA